VNSPVELLTAAFAALNIDDWAGFIELCDPVSLRAFKREKIESYTVDLMDYEFDADDLMESEPDLPPAVAEYQAALMNTTLDPNERLKRDFPMLDGMEELHAIDPGRLFVEWLRMRSPHRAAEFMKSPDEESWEKEAEWEEPVDPRQKHTRGYRYSVLGCIADGEDIAHAFFRTEHGVDKIFVDEYAEQLDSLPDDEQKLARQLHHRSHPEFATCRRQEDGTWRLVADWTLRLISTREEGRSS
jgi:hypothetical protein